MKSKLKLNIEQKRLCGTLMLDIYRRGRVDEIDYQNAVHCFVDNLDNFLFFQFTISANNCGILY